MNRLELPTTKGIGSLQVARRMNRLELYRQQGYRGLPRQPAEAKQALGVIRRVAARPILASVPTGQTTREC